MTEASLLPPLLLIHGAWQGAWVWTRLLPELAAAGMEAHTVDLPGNGWGPHAQEPASLESYTAHVLDALGRVGRPAVVLGHSGGGITASQVAEKSPENIAALVFLTGMMLPDGMSYADLVAMDNAATGVPVAGIGAHLQWSDDHRFSRVPAAAARAIFLHDADDATAMWAAERLTPQPESGRAMAPRLSPARYGTVPRLYIEATDDHSVTPSLQRRMQALQPGALRLELQCGHVPQLVRPRDTAQALRAGLHKLLSRGSDS